MTLVSVVCPHCGDVNAAPSEIKLTVIDGEESFYRFACPRCRTLITKPANQRVITALVSCGVYAAILSPSQRPTGPPLTEDDLIAFGREVEARRSPFEGEAA